jgi:hypothetical protein
MPLGSDFTPSDNGKVPNLNPKPFNIKPDPNAKVKLNPFGNPPPQNPPDIGTSWKKPDGNT